MLTEGAEYGPTITSDGKYMYLGSTGARARVTAINRAANGNISKIQTIKTDLNNNELQNSEQISISPDNKNLYVSSVSFDSHLYVFNISGDGSLTSKKTFIHRNNATTTYAYPEDIPVTGSGGSGTAISNDGKFFYSVGGYGDEKDSISIFNRSSNGSLNFIKNILASLSDIGTLRILFAADTKLVISPNQKFIYVHDGIMNNIGVWRRNFDTGDAYNAVIKVKAPATEGQITNTATVTSDQLDTNTANNTDTETTNIDSDGTPTTPTTPSTDEESGGGGSMPLGFILLMLIPMLLRVRKMKK